MYNHLIQLKQWIIADITNHPFNSIRFIAQILLTMIVMLSPLIIGETLYFIYKKIQRKKPQRK